MIHVTLLLCLRPFWPLQIFKKSLKTWWSSLLDNYIFFLNNVHSWVVMCTKRLFGGGGQFNAKHKIWRNIHLPLPLKNFLRAHTHTYTHKDTYVQGPGAAEHIPESTGLPLLSPLSILMPFEFQTTAFLRPPAVSLSVHTWHHNVSPGRRTHRWASSWYGYERKADTTGITRDNLMCLETTNNILYVWMHMQWG